MAFVQKANAGVWNSTLVNSKSAAAFGANITAGNALWALISYDSTGTAPSSVTLGGQTATLFASVTDTTNAQVAAIYYVLNATGGTTASGTVTFGAGTNNFIAVDVVEESGVATSAATDGSGVKFVTPAAATGTTAAFTPTTSGDIMAIVSAWAGATAIGTPTGTNTTFTNRDSVGSVDTAVANGVQSAAASTTATWTWTTNANAAIVLGAFKASGGSSVSGTVADTLTATDAQSVVTTFNGTLADTLTITDARSVVTTFNGTLADTLTPTDAQSVVTTFNGTVADTLSLTDDQTASVSSGGIAGTVADSLTPVDDQSVVTTFNGTVADSLTLVDAQTATSTADTTAQPFGGGWTMKYKKKKEEVDRIREDLAAAIEALQPRPKVEIPVSNSEFTPEQYVPRDVYAEMRQAQAVAEDTREWLVHMRKAVVRARQKRAINDLLLFGD